MPSLPIWFEGLEHGLPAEVGRLLRAFAGGGVGDAWFLETTEEAATARVRSGMAPTTLPIAVTPTSVLALHLHPRLVTRGCAPVVERTHDGSWLERATSLRRLIARLFALQEFFQLGAGMAGRLDSGVIFNKFRWATNGSPPWPPRSHLPTDASSHDVLDTLGLAGPADRLLRIAAAATDADPARIEELLRDLRRFHVPHFAASVWGGMFAYQHGSAEVALERFEHAILAPAYCAGNPRDWAAIVQRLISIDGRGVPLHPRVALAAAHPDGDSRLEVMLPGLAARGETALVFEESVNAGFLLDDYGAVLPTARLAASRLPERAWLVPLLDFPP